MLLSLKMKGKSNEQKPLKTDHEVKTAKFMEHMTGVLTENKSVSYRSKIMEQSLVYDKKSKVVQVDTNSV